MPLSIGFVGFEGLTGLDLAGPLEVFAMANDLRPDTYEVLILAPTSDPFVSGAGLKHVPHMALGVAPELDTIIVPGGSGIRQRANAVPIIGWLKERSATRRICSVCTGIYALAAAGFLEDRRATTHWRFVSDVARKFPSIRLDKDAIHIRDGRIYTSAGVTAGIDLALALVEEDLGREVALAIARELVVYLKRPGGQLQFSEPLRFQIRATNRFEDLPDWIIANLSKKLTVEQLATRVRLGKRHFNRRFRQTFGCSPAAYVERLRLDSASERLGAPNQTVDSVAASVGYASVDTFRRAFVRRFGILPSAHARDKGDIRPR